MTTKVNLYSCTVTSAQAPFESANIDFIADEATKEGIARIVAKLYVKSPFVSVTNLVCLQRDINLVLGRESVEFVKP